MFAKLFTLAFVATLAVAAPAPNGGSGSTTGTPLCCQSVTNSDNLDSTTVGLIKTLLGIDVSGLNIPIGQGCAGLSVVGGVSCNQNPVTCGSVVQGELHRLFKKVLVLTSSCRA
jgi:hypothetical protein